MPMQHAHRITVSLDDGDADELVALATQQGISASALVRVAVRRLLTDRAILLPVVHRQNKQRTVSEQVEAQP